MKRFAPILALALVAVSGLAQNTSFALRRGDRVAMYGDSITDNGPYTYFVETFTSLRYPNLDVSFENAGVGGDRVTGGWMGPIDQRLTRDLFSRRPTVVTVMLGMNDASYRPFDQTIFDVYRNGYRHMVERIKREAPGARVWLIQPSPFDDVNQAPGWDPGYNSVLRQYADFVRQLAGENGFGVIDLNTPMVDMLTRAKANNADLAKKIIPDRVHPGTAGHMVMGTAVLKAWNASSLVSDLTYDWAVGTVIARNAEVSGLSGHHFVVREKTLPMPFNRADPQTALVLQSSDVDQALNHEVLRVAHMPAGSYTLNIDGKPVGSFSDTEFANGINLATLDTPMNRQAQQVADLTGRLGNLRYNRWRTLEFGFQDMPGRARQDAINGSMELERSLWAQRKAAAQPVSHKFEIVKVG